MKQYRIRVSGTQVWEYIVEGENAQEADDIGLGLRLIKNVMAGECGKGRLVDSTINDVEVEEVQCLSPKAT